MNSPRSRTIPMLIWRSVVQAITLAVLAGFILSFVYGLTYHYKETHRHIDQLAAVLTASASTAEGADIVAEQVAFLLENEPSIQSILFYSTPQPISDTSQSRGDWKNALFADTVSFNYPVVSNDLQPDSLTIAATFSDADGLPRQSSDVAASSSTTKNANSTLVGYINITLDVNKLRASWFQSNALLWLVTILLAVVWALYILRKLNWPVRDLDALTEVCDIIIRTPELEKLPVIAQHFNFQELVQIKQALIVLFKRLQDVKQDYEAVAIFEQQLHSKDVSLDVQLHNFQSMITHELKTSLNAIVGGLQLLDYETLSREQKDAVDIISSGSDKLVSSLEHIIQLNQIQKGQMTIHLSEFNPLQLIADLLAEFEPVAKRKGLELISQVHHIDYGLQGDVKKIQQILSILLSNAIKFTSAGQVTITSQLTHFDKSNRWQISVKDTGIGIDNNHIDDIFNPFFQVDSSQTRQYEGSGIGLPVVKQMAQLMGASIDVHSELGVGTEFVLTIPLPNQQQAHQQQVLAGLSIIYYYYHEAGFLVEELERLGAQVICHQHEQLALDEMRHKKIDIVMFAEDVYPARAEALATRIRQIENADITHRALLIYWYPKHHVRSLESFEHGLKAAGVDYCHMVTYSDKGLSDLIKRWLVWT